MCTLHVQCLWSDFVFTTIIDKFLLCFSAVGGSSHFQVMCAGNLVKFGNVAPEICRWVDRQTAIAVLRSHALYFLSVSLYYCIVYSTIQLIKAASVLSKICCQLYQRCSNRFTRILHDCDHMTDRFYSSVVNAVFVYLQQTLHRWSKWQNHSRSVLCHVISSVTIIIVNFDSNADTRVGYKNRYLW